MIENWIKNVNYRGYKAGDEQRIVNFFNECGYNPNIKFWKWINENSPYGKTIFRVAEINNKIICHYSVLPKLVRIKNKEIKAGLGVHLAAHPEFRSTEVVINVMNFVYKVCRDMGIKIVYGFPNDNSWLLSQRLLGWVKVFDMPALEKPLDGIILDKNIERLNVKSKFSFTDKHVFLIKKIVTSEFISIKKNLNYLNWRYKYHPSQKYYLIEKADPQNKGFLILKLYKKNNLQYGHILEMGLLEQNYFETLEILLNNAISFFKNHSVDIISTWINENHPLFLYFKEAGFRPSGFITHFGYKNIDINSKYLNKLNWFITMGDSDAF